MAKERLAPARQQKQINLVLCEGKTEVSFLEKNLQRDKYKILGSSYSNAQMLVCESAVKYNKDRDWHRTYCVFDRDQASNTREQLEKANKFIKSQRGKYIRIFSNPCFETALWFNYSNRSKLFDNCAQVENAISDHIGYTYSKKDMINGKLLNKFNFQLICENAKLVYKQLEINDNNWLNEMDAYSEIFKFKQ